MSTNRQGPRNQTWRLNADTGRREYSRTPPPQALELSATAPAPNQRDQQVQNREITRERVSEITPRVISLSSRNHQQNSRRPDTEGVRDFTDLTGDTGDDEDGVSRRTQPSRYMSLADVDRTCNSLRVNDRVIIAWRMYSDGTSRPMSFYTTRASVVGTVDRSDTTDAGNVRLLADGADEPFLFPPPVPVGEILEVERFTVNRCQPSWTEQVPAAPRINSGAALTHSAYFCPLIAAASGYHPVRAANLRAWALCRETIGHELFDAAATFLRGHADLDDLDWDSNDHLTEEDQNDVIDEVAEHNPGSPTPLALFILAAQRLRTAQATQSAGTRRRDRQDDDWAHHQPIRRTENAAQTGPSRPIAPANAISCEQRPNATTNPSLRDDDNTSSSYEERRALYLHLRAEFAPAEPAEPASNQFGEAFIDMGRGGGVITAPVCNGLRVARDLADEDLVWSMHLWTGTSGDFGVTKWQALVQAAWMKLGVSARSIPLKDILDRHIAQAAIVLATPLPPAAGATKASYKPRYEVMRQVAESFLTAYVSVEAAATLHTKVCNQWTQGRLFIPAAIQEAIDNITVPTAPPPVAPSAIVNTPVYQPPAQRALTQSSLEETMQRLLHGRGGGGGGDRRRERRRRDTNGGAPTNTRWSEPPQQSFNSRNQRQGGQGRRRQ